MIDVVAIDGPVGVGKSAVAARLAERLGWLHLDTGAMYRAVALLALRRNVSLHDAPACAELARGMDLKFAAHAEGQRAILEGEDVSDLIRQPVINSAVSSIADIPAVRAELGRRQRAMGEAGRSVAEGRDMGTVVFPDARWKFFVDADPHERARRRGAQLSGDPAAMPDAALMASVAERDRRDRTRPVGALRIAEDAVILDTTGIGMDRVVAILESLVRGDAA